MPCPAAPWQLGRKLSLANYPQCHFSLSLACASAKHPLAYKYLCNSNETVARAMPTSIIYLLTSLMDWGGGAVQ